MNTNGISYEIQKCMPCKIYLGSCQGQNTVTGHGVFAPATPQVLIRAYISAVEQYPLYLVSLGVIRH